MAVYARTGWFRPDLHGIGGEGSVPLGFRPVAVMFWSNKETTFGGGQAVITRTGAGFSARTPSGGVETRLRLSQFTALAGKTVASTTLYPAATGSVEPLKTTALNETGFSWQADSGFLDLPWAWLAIGGDDVQAALRQVTVPAGSANGTFSVTGLGFVPKAALALPARSGQMIDGLAAFVPGGGGFGVVQSARNGVSPTQATISDGTRLEFRYPTSTSASAVAARIELAGADAGSLTFRHDAASDGSAQMLMLALGGDGLAATVTRGATTYLSPLSVDGLGVGAARAIVAAHGQSNQVADTYVTSMAMGFGASPGPQWIETFAWHNTVVINNTPTIEHRAEKNTNALLAPPGGIGGTNMGTRIIPTWTQKTVTGWVGFTNNVYSFLLLAEAVRPNSLGTAASVTTSFLVATLAGGTVLTQTPALPSQAVATATVSAAGIDAAILLGTAIADATSAALFSSEVIGFGSVIAFGPVTATGTATVAGAVGNAVPLAGVTPQAVTVATVAEATRLADPAQSMPATETVAAAVAEAALSVGWLAATADRVAETAERATVAGWLLGYEWPTILAATAGDVPGTVNYVPDPAYETGIGWSVVSGAGTASLDAWAGSRSLQWAMGTVNRTLRIETVRGLGFADGGTYIGSVRVKGPLSGVQARLEAVYADATVETGAESETAAGADWTLVTTPPLATDPAKALDHLRLRLNNATAGTILVDGAQIERGVAITGWCSGALGVPAGEWLGLENASPSWRQTIRTVRGTAVPAGGTPLAAPAADVPLGAARAAGGDMPLGAPFGDTGGRGGAIRVEAQLFRATYDNRFLEDISEWVVSGRVDMDTSRDVTWSFDATLLGEGWSRLTPYLDWVAPYLTVTYPNGTVSQGQLGLYLVMDSPVTRREYGSTVQLTAMDPLWLLSAQGLPYTTVASSGTVRTEFVKTLLNGAVLTQNDVANGTQNAARRYLIPTATLLNNQPAPFTQAAEFPAGTSRLRAINDVLLSAGCTPLYTTRTGVFTSRRLNLTLGDKLPVRTYAANAPAGWSLDNRIDRGLFGDIIEAVDTTPYADGLQNEVLLVNDDPVAPIQVRYRITDTDNYRSFAAGSTGKNRRNIRRVTNAYLAHNELGAQVARALAEALSLRNQSARLRVVPEPHLEVAREVVGLAVFDADGEPVITGRWAVQRATYGFTPSDAWMELEVARVYGITGVAEVYR